MSFLGWIWKSNNYVARLRVSGSRPSDENGTHCEGTANINDSVCGNLAGWYEVYGFLVVQRGFPAATRGSASQEQNGTVKCVSFQVVLCWGAGPWKKLALQIHESLV